MYSRRYTWAMMLIVGTLVLSGCTTAAAEPTTEIATGTPQAAPTVGAPAEEEPTRTPEPVPTQAVAQMRNVAYEGIRFTFDPAMAAEVLAERVPTTEMRPGWTIGPHTRFLFDGYVLPETFHAPRILVYPVAECKAVNEHVAKTIADLEQLLLDRPATPATIPVLPAFHAGQMMRARVAYVDFQNGTGVRFLTQYAQAYLPINNHEIFYTFQGLTDDGQAYVAAILPVAHPSLPASQKAYEGGDVHALIRRFDAYIVEIEKQLAAQDASSFVPDLNTVDTMIQSLEVEPQQATAPTIPGKDLDTDTPRLTVDEFAVVAAAVDSPGHLEYSDRIGEEVLERLRARAAEGLLVRSNAALAPFGYRLLPRFDLQWNRTTYDVYQGEGEGPMLLGLSNVWPASVNASGSDFILAAENTPNAVPRYLLISKDGVEEWDAEASVLLAPAYVGEALARVTCTGYPALTCQVALDGQAVYTGTALAVGAYMPLRSFTSWDSHWALEVDDHLIVDGEDVGQARGYDAAFGFALIRGRPFYLYEQDGTVRISYDGQTLPNVYEEVFHNQCCEGAIHNIEAGGDVAWFHALRDGTWYFVVVSGASYAPAVPLPHAQSTSSSTVAAPSAIVETLPVPSATPVLTLSERWQTYSDPEYDFSISYPRDLEITEKGSSGPCGTSLHVGDQVCVRITDDDPLHGRRPSAFGVVESTDSIIVAGLEAIQVTGYIGSIGGYVPQRYTAYVIERNGLYYDFMLYALSFHSKIDDISVIWPLKADDIALFEQIVRTLEFAD